MRKEQDWSVYRPPHPALRNEGLTCLGAGEQSGALRTIYARELNSYALVVVSSGKGKVWGPNGMGSAASVTAPACFWIPPSLKHGYGPGPEGWTEHWMVFSGATTSALQLLGVLRPESALKPMPLLDDQAITLFAFLNSALSKAGPAGDLRASALALLIISACMGVGDQEDHVVQGLRNQAYSGVSVESYAKSVGMSQSMLRRKILASAGVTPKELVMQQRLGRAQNLLVETDLPIHHVAVRVGYKDAGHFSRLFVRRLGMSPLAFRREQRGALQRGGVEGSEH